MAYEDAKIYVPGYAVIPSENQLYTRVKCKHTEFRQHMDGTFVCNSCETNFDFCPCCNKSFASSTLLKYDGVCGRCFAKGDFTTTQDDFFEDDFEADFTGQEYENDEYEDDEYGDDLRQQIRHLATSYRT